MPGLEVFVIAAVVAVIIAAIYLGQKAAKERTVALGNIAARFQWRFYGEAKDSAFPEAHRAFEVFQRGRNRYAHNVLTGRLGAFGTEVAAEAGDYHYQVTSGSGKHRNTQTYRFSYLVVTLPFGTNLPSLVVRPEGLFDKVAGAVGFEDIDFESAEFSRRYHVSGSDRRFAYNLIDPRMIEYLLEVGPPRFELGGGELLIVSNEARTRWEPEEFAHALRWTEAFLARWPTFLVRDLLPS